MRSAPLWPRKLRGAQRQGSGGAARCRRSNYKAALSVADDAGPYAYATDFLRRPEKAYPIRDRGCARVPATRGQGTSSRIDRSRSLLLRLSARPLSPRPGNRKQSHSSHCPLLKRRSALPWARTRWRLCRARYREPSQAVAELGGRQLPERMSWLPLMGKFGGRGGTSAMMLGGWRSVFLTRNSAMPSACFRHGALHTTWQSGEAETCGGRALRGNQCDLVRWLWSRMRVPPRRRDRSDASFGRDTMTRRQSSPLWPTSICSMRIFASSSSVQSRSTAPSRSPSWSKMWTR